MRIPPPEGLKRRHFLTAVAAAFTLPRLARADNEQPWPVELIQPAIVSPLGLAGLFNNICLAGNRLVAVGERGRILLSDDNGISWRQVPVPVSVTLICARFLDARNGWVAGQMGVVLKTTDGGESWVKVLDGLQAANMLLAEANADAAKAASAGGAAVASPAAANAASSGSQGPTELQNAQQFVSEGPSNPLLSILPLTETHLLAFGAYGLALETLNGGKDWAGIVARVPDPQGLHIYGSLQLNNSVVLVGEQGLILQGQPEGQLNAVHSPFAGSLFGILAASATELLAFGIQGTLLFSSNGGLDWSTQTVPRASGFLSGAVLRDGRILLGDQTGNLILTADNGKSFTYQPPQAPVTALCQAADGSVIVGGPNGLRRLSLDVLG